MTYLTMGRTTPLPSVAWPFQLRAPTKYTWGPSSPTTTGARLPDSELTQVTIAEAFHIYIIYIIYIYIIYMLTYISLDLYNISYKPTFGASLVLPLPGRGVQGNPPTKMSTSPWGTPQRPPCRAQRPPPGPWIGQRQGIH